MEEFLIRFEYRSLPTVSGALLHASHSATWILNALYMCGTRRFSSNFSLVLQSKYISHPYMLLWICRHCWITWILVYSKWEVDGLHTSPPSSFLWFDDRIIPDSDSIRGSLLYPRQFYRQFSLVRNVKRKEENEEWRQNCVIHVENLKHFFFLDNVSNRIHAFQVE